MASLPCLQPHGQASLPCPRPHGRRSFMRPMRPMRPMQEYQAALAAASKAGEAIMTKVQGPRVRGGMWGMYIYMWALPMLLSYGHGEGAVLMLLGAWAHAGAVCRHPEDGRR